MNPGLPPTPPKKKGLICPFITPIPLITAMPDGKEGDMGFIKIWCPLFAPDCNSNRGASWVPTPNPPLFL